MQKYKIVKNPDSELYEEIKVAVNNNLGYCPCSIVKNDDTKCVCKQFREQDSEGECHCGLLFKVLSN